jgi:predicted phage tail protein
MISKRLLSILWIALASAGALWGCSSGEHITAANPTQEDTSPPPAPEDLDIVSQPENHRLTWTPSSAPDVVFYEVYQYLPNPTRDNSYVRIGEAAGSSFNLEPNQQAVEAYFRVRAVDTIGNRSPLSTAYGATLTPISLGGTGKGTKDTDHDPRLRLAD